MSCGTNSTWFRHFSQMPDDDTTNDTEKERISTHIWLFIIGAIVVALYEAWVFASKPE